LDRRQRQMYIGDSDKIVAQFGDIPDSASNPDEDDDASSTTSAPKRRGKRPVRAINVPDDWAAMEERMENEMSEVINDPNTIYHAASYAKAQRRAAAQRPSLTRRTSIHSNRAPHSRPRPDPTGSIPAVWPSHPCGCGLALPSSSS